MRETRIIPTSSLAARALNGLNAPSSIRPTSTIEDNRTDDAVNDLASNEDLLADFDVNPEEREYLTELMRMAPENEVAMLQKARHGEIAYGRSVKDFARSHPIYELAPGKTDEGMLSQFRKDVYEFSKASGMKKKKAKAESWRALATWVTHAALEDGLSSGEDFIESTAPKLTQAKDYYKIDVSSSQAEIRIERNERNERKKEKKRRKREKEGGNQNEKEGIPVLSDDDTQAPVFVASNTLQATALPHSGEKKRKLSSSETQIAQGRNPEAIQNKRHHSEFGSFTNGVGDIQVDPTTSRPATKRSKPGPTTSAYFPIPQTSLEEHEAPKKAGGIPVMLAVGDNTTSGSRRDRKRKRLANAKPAEAEISTRETDVARRILPIPPILPMHSTYFPVKAIGGTAAASQPKSNQQAPLQGAVRKAPSEYPASHVQSADEHTDQAPDVHKSPKRKRKRNKNRLGKTELESQAIDADRQHEPHNQQQSAQAGPHYAQRGTATKQSTSRILPPNANGVAVITVPLHVRDITGRDEEEARAETNSVKRQRGDRGRSSKRQPDLDTGDSGLTAGENPLAELDHENSSAQKRERRDRGRGRKRSSFAMPFTEENDQQSKDCHS
jgi:hypothetical protein